MKYSIQPRYDAINDCVVYIPQPAAGSELDLHDISRIISQNCTLTRPDVVAVLTALEDLIGHSLAQGYHIRLGTLGSFRLRMRAAAVATPEEAGPQCVRSYSVQFRPSPILRKHLEAITLEKEDAK